MSKYNHYTNYSKPPVMSEPTPDAENTLAQEVEEVVEAEETEEVVDTIMVEAAQLAVDAEEEEITPPAEPKSGVVTANKLNIRKLPAPTAEVVTIVEKDTTLMIDPEYETVEWYKVYTPAGIEGYCMKKFVKVK